MDESRDDDRPKRKGPTSSGAFGQTRSIRYELMAGEPAGADAPSWRRFAHRTSGCIDGLGRSPSPRLLAAGRGWRARLGRLRDGGLASLAAGLARRSSLALFARGWLFRFLCGRFCAPWPSLRPVCALPLSSPVSWLRLVPQPRSRLLLQQPSSAAFFFAAFLGADFLAADFFGADYLRSRALLADFFDADFFLALGIFRSPVQICGSRTCRVRVRGRAATAFRRLM